MRPRLASAALLAVLAGPPAAQDEETARLDAFPVRVAEVRRSAIEDGLSLVGSLKARDEATSSRASTAARREPRQGGRLDPEGPGRRARAKGRGRREVPSPRPCPPRSTASSGGSTWTAAPRSAQHAGRLVVDVRSMRARPTCRERYGTREAGPGREGGGGGLPGKSSAASSRRRARWWTPRPAARPSR